MKKRLPNLSLDAVLRAAQRAGQEAVRDAVAAGRVVTGWKDGHLVEYGPGRGPLGIPGDASPFIGSGDV